MCFPVGSGVRRVTRMFQRGSLQRNMAPLREVRTPRVQGFCTSPEMEQAIRSCIVISHGAGSNCEAPLMWPSPRRSPESDGWRCARTSPIASNAVTARRLTPARATAGHSPGSRRASQTRSTPPGIWREALQAYVQHAGRRRFQLAQGLLLLSYPLHPPNQPAKLRTEHFSNSEHPHYSFRQAANDHRERVRWRAAPDPRAHAIDSRARSRPRTASQASDANRRWLRGLHPIIGHITSTEPRPFRPYRDGEWVWQSLPVCLCAASGLLPRRNLTGGRRPAYRSGGPYCRSWHPANQHGNGRPGGSYTELSADRPGLLGSLTARSEAQVCDGRAVCFGGSNH